MCQRCSRCRIELTSENAWTLKSGPRAGKLCGKCKSCSRLLCSAGWEKRKDRANTRRRAAYTLAHQQEIQERARQREIREAAAAMPRQARYPQGSRTAAQEFIALAKQHPCMDCGRRFPSAAMDFHHRDPKQKSGNMNAIRKYSVDRVREELAKCDLLCACCHRIRHDRERHGLPATFPPPDYEI